MRFPYGNAEVEAAEQDEEVEEEEGELVKLSVLTLR